MNKEDYLDKVSSDCREFEVDPEYDAIADEQHELSKEALDGDYTYQELNELNRIPF